MKIAIVGSRGLNVDLKKYIPDEVTEIVSGGARGIDYCAKVYALENNIKLKEYYPEYNKYGRYAPLKRNIEIIKSVDMVFAFWYGSSHGTRFVIENCRKMNVPVRVFKPKKRESNNVITMC